MVVPDFDATTYPSGVSFAFDLLESKVGGYLSFISDPTYDMDNFPELPQPILVRVQTPPPYGISLTRDWPIARGMLGAVKVEVLQKPSPGKVYGTRYSNVVFWNWPDQTPPAFSAFVLRCNPQLLPDKVVRYAEALFQGYLRDTKDDMTFLGDTSNYLSLIGLVPDVDEIAPGCQAYYRLNGSPVEVGSDYIEVPPSPREAVQYLDYSGLGGYYDNMIGEAAPDLGYWVALLPFHEELSFFKDVLLAEGHLLPPEDEEEEGGEA